MLDGRIVSGLKLIILYRNHWPCRPFWIPNVILSSDYLISVTPLKVAKGKGNLSIPNLMSLLPSKKYAEAEGGWEALYELGIDKVIADLYFTLPLTWELLKRTRNGL